MDLIKRFEKFVNKIENSKTPMIYYILTFIFAITLRFFIETFLRSPFELNYYSFIHNQVYFTAITMAIIILIHYATNEKVGKIARLMLPLILTMNLPPILDSIISSGKGYEMTYMFPEIHENILLRYLTFYGQFDPIKGGITPGMRIETVLMLSGLFMYFYAKKRSIPRTIFFTLIAYTLIFTFLSLPFILELLNLDTSGTTFINFFLLLTLIFSSWMLYLHDKNLFKKILKETKSITLLHYELMLIVGVILSLPINNLTSDYAFKAVFIVSSIILAWLFIKLLNNQEVIQSKPIAWTFLLLAITYSLASGIKALLLITLFIGNYYLYLIPPFKFKRIPQASKIIITLNSLIIIYLGYIFNTASDYLTLIK